MGTLLPDTRARRLAELRGLLLRASTRAEAIDIASGALRELLGLEPGATILFGDGRQAVPEGAFALRSAGHDHGHFVLDAEGPRLDAARDDVRIIADDLAEALTNVTARAAAREMTRLREALARRDELVRQAGDALIRDSHEVVRVVGELEERDSLIKEDLQQALRFQKAMIAAPPAHERLATSAVYLAAEMISGDFYDVALLGRNWLRVLIADATGHGVAAGLATMFIKSEYEAQKRISQSPAAVLRAINEQLSATYRNLELQFTALCMDLHISAGRLCYASAAHPGPILVRSATPTFLPSGGPFVGVMTGLDFPEREVAIEPGDMLVGFSDGLLDATAADGASFGESGIVTALAGVEGNAAEACPALVRALASFVGEGRGLCDDVTVVALSIPRDAD